MQSQPSGGGRVSLRRSLWTYLASAPERYAPLATDRFADVVVVGAGVAGASTALHLASAGVKVAVVEAEQPGAGATGQSGGLVAPNFIGMTPDGVDKAFGPERGARLTQLIGRSAGQVFDLISSLDIACDARQEGFWTPAHTPALAQEQRLQAKQWQARGFAVDFVDEAQTRDLLGSDRYHGGLCFADGGQVNPLALACGLIERAIERGAQVFGDSPVERVERDGANWTVRTARGSLRAAKVVLAANGGNAQLHPRLKRTTLPLRVMEFATPPLSMAQRAAILPRGGSFTDKQSYLFTARYDEGGRLISAVPLSAALRGRQAYEREAQGRLMRHFPSLGCQDIEHLWVGTAWLNTSFLPSVYAVEDGLYAIQACNGRGLPTNVVLGEEVASSLLSGTFQALSVDLQEPAPIRFHALARFAPYAMMTLAYLQSRLRDVGR